MLKNLPKNSEIAVLEVWILQKISLPPAIVGALIQSYIKNGGSKIRQISFQLWKYRVLTVKTTIKILYLVHTSG